MDSEKATEKKCWVTLVTKDSYLPGAIILAHSLDKAQSKHPLVVLYTSSLSAQAIEALNAEADIRGRIKARLVEQLIPRPEQRNVSSVAKRFADTFTKLRAFEIHRHGFTKACFLDADMAVYRNPDAVLEHALPNYQSLIANHACVCTLDRNIDTWAPPNWNKGNCAYTTLTGPEQVLKKPTGKCRPTYNILNGGLFMFHPTEKLWQAILDCFNTSNKLSTYQFPDQDFIADFFRDSWQPISWKYNALKTMRYVHPKVWSDEHVVIVHYIVDKPWERRVSADGIAGHRGRDGVTHQWWWNLYEEWLGIQSSRNDIVLATMLQLLEKEKPFTHIIPLPQEPGKPEDIESYLTD